MSTIHRTFGAVTVLTGTKNGKYPDGNSLLVRGRDATLLIDPSLSVAARPDDFGQVDLVVQSHVHEDHVAGLFRFPRVPVHAHREDVAGLHSLAGLMAIYGGYATTEGFEQWVTAQFNYSPRPDAQPYDDGARFELGGVTVRAIHLPGHTRGHCALLVEPDGMLFLGDIDLSSFGPYYGDAWSNLGDFERSLARVRDIAARVWVTFHHVGVIEDRAAFLARLDRFTARIAEREQALLAYLAEPRTLAELVAHRFLYPRDAQLTWADGVERRTIEQHLERLTAGGRVERCGEDAWHRR
jgi:glyoxylase-like metal-dependent hydrolase (beta-lactamase superfamily II)